MAYQDQTNPGLFVPNTFIWDVQNLYEVDVNSAQFKELLVRLYQNLNTIAITLNKKESALYPLAEFITGQSFFPDPSLSSTTTQAPTERQVFRKVINFGALPNATSKTAAHGLTITSTYSLTRLYGGATDPSTAFIPLPYASPTAANNIELSMDATNVTVTTGSDRTAFTTCYIVIEYLKS